jgi:hypothetical protein
MKTFINKSRNIPCVALTAAVALLGLAAIQTQAQSITYTFADGTSDGWTLGGFSAGADPTVSNIGGQNYIFIATGSFQAANVGSGYAGNLASFNAAMGAALLNPSGYDISYNWAVNTANNVGGTFLQLGTFLNATSGYYEQDYSTPNEVALNGTQLASGGILTGTVTINLAAVFPSDASAATETSFRLGLIVNGNGTDGAYFSNISVSPVPEPATLSLCGLGLASGLMYFRRRKA